MLGNTLGARHRDRVKKTERKWQGSKISKVWAKNFEACRQGRTYTSNCRTEFRLCGTGVSQVGTQLILLLLGTRVCVCVCVGAGHWKWGQRRGKQLGKRLEKTRPHAGDGGLCVFTQLVGPQDGCKWTDCLPARPPKWSPLCSRPYGGPRTLPWDTS